MPARLHIQIETLASFAPKSLTLATSGIGLALTVLIRTSSKKEAAN